MGHDDYLKPLTDFLGVSGKESDRGRVLVAPAQIDSMLETVLRSFLLDGEATDRLFQGPNAPMASLFNKLNTARALGLLTDDEWSTINTLRKIRNEFAHAVHVKMSDPKISALVTKLEFGLSDLLERNDPVLQNELARFSMCTVSLISAIYNRAHYVSKHRQTEVGWPP